MAKKSSKRRSAAAAHDGDITDARFAAAATRPQFAKARTGASSASRGDEDAGGGSLVVGGSSSGLGASLTHAIASDDRFKAALDSDRFGVVPSRDKYGRKARKTKKKKEEGDNDGNYDFDDDDEEEPAGNDDKKSGRKSKRRDESDDEEEADTSMEARIAYLNALSRGDISASSSSESSSDDDSDGGSDDDDSSASSTNVHGKSGIFDPSHKTLPGDVPSDEEELTDEPSPYLCLLNLNWEHTRAVDVYAMLHSFCPPGTLRGVAVYPSDFGRERMERERVEGPTGLWKRAKAGGEEESEDGSESEGSSDGSDEENDMVENSPGGESDGSDASEDDDEEDALNLAEATAKLYAHFPPQSSIMKNSQLQTEEEEEAGFDLEKLREYEASKLRYYFAVATFSSAAAAAAAYEHVDGMEMEDSAAEIDVRVLPKEHYQSTIEGRKARDTCDQLPAKYAPPEDNVASALRQSRVTCSWERGDAERERKLTRYGMGKEAWEALAEGDDIGFYLAASDSSSGEEEEGEEKGEGGRTKKNKGAGMRALLGLAGSDSEDAPSASGDSSSGSDSDDSGEKEGAVSKPSKAAPTESESESESEEDEAEEATATAKQATFTPGKRALEQKIRSKLHAKQAGADGAGEAGEGEGEALTPFQKYLEKRKQKRRERRQAARNARKGGANDDNAANVEGKRDEDDGMYAADPEFGVARFSDEESDNGKDGAGRGGDDAGAEDGFFLGESSGKTGRRKKQTSAGAEEAVRGDNVASTKEELELLIAGDDDEEAQKDYDMRGLAKLERHAHKKLRGKRKRRLDALAANVSGRDFRIDADDDRFAALLDGDDERFGIDRTNPAYKETGAMKELLQEQTKRRARKHRGEGKTKKAKSDRSSEEAEDKDGGWTEKSSGAMALSSLVKSLKQKVPKGGDGRKRKKKAAQ